MLVLKIVCFTNYESFGVFGMFGLLTLELLLVVLAIGIDQFHFYVNSIVDLGRRSSRTSNYRSARGSAIHARTHPHLLLSVWLVLPAFQSLGALYGHRRGVRL